MANLNKYKAVCSYKGTYTVLKGVAETSTQAALTKIVLDNGKDLRGKIDDADLDRGWSYEAGVMRMGSAEFFLIAFSMTATNFAFWVAHMKATRRWSARECARQLNCGTNQILRWSTNGAPRYIGLACAALAVDLKPWKQG